MLSVSSKAAGSGVGWMIIMSVLKASERSSVAHCSDRDFMSLSSFSNTRPPPG